MNKYFRVLALVLILCIPFVNVSAATSKKNESNQIVINFKDKHLEKAIRLKIKKTKGSIYSTDVMNIKELKLVNIGITDITPLKWFKNLTKLELQNIESPNPNDINDIYPLKDLKMLTYLDLSWNEIHDTSALKGLANLTNLYITYPTVITDLSFINNLKQLKSLSLEGICLKDISSLSKFNNLEELNLGGTNIVDILPLKNLKKIESLTLSNNKIENLNPLKELTTLKYLELSNNAIEDVTPLSNLKKLNYLQLKGNPITDFSCIKPYYSQLKDSDFKPVKYLTFLDYTDFKSTPGCKLRKLDFEEDSRGDLRDLIIFHMSDEMNIGEKNIQSIEYNMDRKYDTIEGYFGCYQYAKGTDYTSCFKVFGDGKLLYTSPYINVKDDSLLFKVDVNDVSKLKFQIESPGKGLYSEFEYFLKLYLY